MLCGLCFCSLVHEPSAGGVDDADSDDIEGVVDTDAESEVDLEDLGAAAIVKTPRGPASIAGKATVVGKTTARDSTAVSANDAVGLQKVVRKTKKKRGACAAQ